MRGAILACGLGLFLAGCNLDPAKSCSSDSDCGAGVCGSQTHTCLASECPSACGANLACVKRACAEVHTSVAITASPEDRGHVGHSVTLTAQLTPAATVTHVDPAQLLISAYDGTDPAEQVTLEQVSGGSDGLYRGTWAPQHDGATYQLTVDPSLAIDGGVSLTAKFTGPQLSVRFLNTPQRQDSNHQDPAMPTAYRRDEHAILEVDATDDLVPSSLTVSVAGTDGVFSLAPQASQFSPCDAGLCGSFDIDLFTPTMNAFRATFPVQLSGSDILGNSSSSDAGIDVTRWKWGFSDPSSTQTSAPAIGHDGMLYVGTVSSTTSGELKVFSPEGSTWSVPTGAIASSVSVGAFDGGELIYAATTDSSGVNIEARRPDGGLVQSCSITGAFSATAVAVTYTKNAAQSPSETALVVGEDSSTSAVLSLRPNEGSTSERCPPAPSGPLFNETQVPVPNVVVANNMIVAPIASASKVQEYSFSEPAWSSLATLDAGVVVSDLALSGDVIEVSSLTPDFAFATEAIDGGTFSAQDYLGVTRTTGVLVDSDAGVFVFADQGAISGAQVFGSQHDETAGILMKGNRLAIAGRNRVEVIDRATGNSIWTVADAGFDRVLAAPTVDCRRAPDGGKIGGPGTLYVVGQNGYVAAFVVDDPGVDTTASWPKYQHDPRNTGNANTDLSEFACP